MNKKIFTLLFTAIQCKVAFGQQISNQDNFVFGLSKDVVEKFILVLVGALLGFLSNYLLAKRKERKETKELSYELDVKEAIIRGDSPIKNHISLQYKNNTIDNLTFVSCIVKNTGQNVIKDENIRFEFTSKDCQILEDYFDPTPQPELAVISETVELERLRFERKYKIGHLVKEKEVKFNFVVGGANPQLKIHDKNPTGDVKFNEKSINIKKSEANTLKNFFFVNFSLILLYPLLNSSFLKNISLDVIWGIAFVILNISFVRPISEILSNSISNRKGKKSQQMEHFSFGGGGNNIVVLDGSGGVSLNQQGADVETLIETFKQILENKNS